MEPLSDNLETKLLLRNTRIEDYDALRSLMDVAYPNMTPWTREQFVSQIETFPEGQICIEDNGQLVAACISLIVNYPAFSDHHKYYDITGKGMLSTHDPDGETLYGADMFVHPEYRDMRLGRRLYDARKELCENLNLKRIIIGGRIPGYRDVADEMSPQEYIKLVRSKERYDPVFSFQIANDFHVRRIVKNYLPEDTDSRSYAVLLEWRNIYYEEQEKLVGGRKSVVRVGALQWQMRPVKSLKKFLNQLEYYVDTVAGYTADFILLPEYFNAPLMALSEQSSPAEAMRELASYSETMSERLTELAVSYNINIIGGSMAEYTENGLRNVSLLFRRDGSSQRQYKLHVTPDEKMYWGLQGGDSLEVFETDVGKIGILICYDVEFPELCRVLADQGINILFVPYWTDTKNAYLRVRRCAQARAIENECYVVISGSVGNLPNVENMDIQYSQSAVFSPSDFAFPHDAVVAEATPNTEMPLIVDLDLDLLKELRAHGSVQNGRDRRRDLYEIRWVKNS